MTREEAINVVRSIYQTDAEKEALAILIPELRESEDERIRKEIIHYILYKASGVSEKQEHEWVAYLERQKKCVADSNKTSADEDESIRKFLVDYFASYKIGNVATILNGVRIDDILTYLEKQKINTEGDFDRGYNCGYEACLNSHGAEWFEKQKEQNLNPSKSVGLEGQKPAQTVDEKEYVRTLKGLVSDFIRDSGGGITDVEYYQNICDWLDGRHIKEPGYKHEDYFCERCQANAFNAGMESVLKEQKPTEYLSEDKVYAIMRKLIKLSYSELIPFESEEFVKISKITSDVRSLLDYPIEQKSTEWSEEDEKMRNLAIEWAETMSGQFSFVDMDSKDFCKIIAWLKSLPLNLKKKNEDVVKLCSNEWSEEDEKNLERVTDCIYEFYPDPVMKYKLKDWLKSLRPQYHGDVTMTEAYKMGFEAGKASSWKPSEEQMDRLFSIVAALRKDYCDDMADFLANLYADLKKLGVKEEPEYYHHFDPDC